MHLPDGFLSPGVSAATGILSLAGIGYSLRKAAAVAEDRMIPLMGVMSAFVFAAQMINFPVPGGTSGHLFGGVLAAVLLGPYAGAVTLACVLVFQCLVLQDGGLTALGANVFNMALAGSAGGYGVYKVLERFMGVKRAALSVGVAAWFSVVFAAALCAVELAVSGTAPLAVVFPAMTGVHALIGLGEAVITVAIIGAILRIRPDLIYRPDRRQRGQGDE